MVRTLAQAREKAGVEEKLAGEALKEVLIAGQVPCLITHVSMDDHEKFGARWRLDIVAQEPIPPHLPVLYFSQNDNRDPDMMAMGDASEDEPYGPLVLEKRGATGFQAWRDA